MAQPRRTVFITDTHGHFAQMIALLCHLGLTDPAGRWIAGEHVDLWHLGDAIHRGPDSLLVIKYLFALQDEMGIERVRTHWGNHEGQYAGLPRCDKQWLPGLDDMLVEAAEAGRIRHASAFTDPDTGEQWLCVHGGLDPRWKDLNKLSAAKAAEAINAMGMDVVRDKDYRVEIVGSGQFRGGHNVVSGVLWADCEEDLRPREKMIRVKQIVGHHVQEQGVNLSQQGKFWAANVPLGDAQALVHDEGVGFRPSLRVHHDMSVSHPPGCAVALAPKLTELGASPDAPAATPKGTPGRPF